MDPVLYNTADIFSRRPLDVPITKPSLGDSPFSVSGLSCAGGVSGGLERWEEDLKQSLSDEALKGVFYDLLTCDDRELLSGKWDALIAQVVKASVERECREGLRYLSFALLSGKRRIPHEAPMDTLALLLADPKTPMWVLERVFFVCLKIWKDIAAWKEANIKGALLSFLEGLNTSRSEKVRFWAVGGRLALSSSCKTFNCLKTLKLMEGSSPLHCETCREFVADILYDFDRPVLLTGWVELDRLKAAQERYDGYLEGCRIPDLEADEVRRIEYGFTREDWTHSIQEVKTVFNNDLRVVEAVQGAVDRLRNDTSNLNHRQGSRSNTLENAPINAGSKEEQVPRELPLLANLPPCGDDNERNKLLYEPD